MATHVIDIAGLQDGKALQDTPSDKDWKYADHRGKLPAVELPKECDLSSRCSAVQTQHGDSSCVAQAVVSAIEFLEGAPKGECEQFSRYFVYYNARRLEQRRLDVADLGTTTRFAISGVAKWGVCAEALWPYIPENLEREPHAPAYAAAREHKLVTYWRLRNNTMEELRDCLARGFPFVFLMRYGADYPHGVGHTGYVRLPTPTELSKPADLATHSVMAVGYNDKTQRLRFMNSKGHAWGDDGFGELSYEYVTDHGLCSDFWTIRKVEDIPVQK